MLSRILISLIIVNVFTHLTMASEQQLACVKKDTAGHKTEQIKSIGDYILKQLGYTEAPNASSQPIPEDKLTDYRMQNQRARVHEKCDVIKGSNAVSVSTIPGKPLHPQGASKPGSESDNTKRASGDHTVGDDVTLSSYDIEFSINIDTKLYKHPRLVELMVYKETPHCSSSQTQDNTFQLVEVIEKSNTSSHGKVIAVKLVDMCSSRGFVSFDVTKAAAPWTEQNLKKIELSLTVKCISPSQCDLNPEHQVSFSTSSKSMKIPHLVIETYVASTDNIQSTIQKQRRKRFSRYNYCSDSTETCCLKELIVNFQEDLNWNFVKLPSEIYINYCGGLCPVGTNSTSSHSIVLGSIHSFNPCCSGADYEAVNLLVDSGNGNFTVLEVPNMTVTSCRCG